MAATNEMLREGQQVFDRRLVLAIYLLFLGGFLTAFSPIAGLVLALYKKNSVSAAWRTHIDFQLRTFTYFWAFVVIAFAYAIFWLQISFDDIDFALSETYFLPVSILALCIWAFIRNIKGLLKAIECSQLDNPHTFMW